MSAMKMGEKKPRQNHCIKQQSAGVRFVKVVVCYRLEPAAGSLVAQQRVGERLQPRAFYLMAVYGKLRILSTHANG
jgi:hypothetical protein